MATPGSLVHVGMGEITTPAVTGAMSAGVGFVVGLTVGVVGALVGVWIYQDQKAKAREERAQGYRYT